MEENNSFYCENVSEPQNIIAPQYDNSLNLPFLKNMISWATFKGVIEIITGAYMCLFFILIIPAVIGVYFIVSGSKLLNSVEDLKKYMSSRDKTNIENALSNMHKYFKFNGIGLIISLCLTVIILILYIVVIVIMIRTGNDLLRIFE